MQAQVEGIPVAVTEILQDFGRKGFEKRVVIGPEGRADAQRETTLPSPAWPA